MCSGKAPKPDPLIGQSAKAMAELSKEAMAFYKQIYAEDLKPMQQRQQALTEQVTGSFLEDSELAREAAKRRMADDIASKPLRDQMVSDAMGYDSQEAVDKDMGIAAANVNQQFSSALGQGQRLRSRYGITGSFGDTNQALLAQASTAAGLMTGAARDRQDKAIALRAGANEAMGGRANSAGQFLGLAGNRMSGALGAGSQMMGDARANAGMMAQGYGIAQQGYQGAGNLMLGDFNGRMEGYNAKMQMIGQLAGAAGTYFGLKP